MLLTFYCLLFRNVTFDLGKNTEKLFDKTSQGQQTGSTSAASQNQTPVDTEETVAKLELNGLTVEKIIALWHDKLQAQLDLFATSAQQVRKRDLILFENRQKITELSKKAQLLKAVSL